MSKAPHSPPQTERRLLWRSLANFAFSRAGLALSLAGTLFIIILIYSLASAGHRAFYQAFIHVSIDAQAIAGISEAGASSQAGFVRTRAAIDASLLESLRQAGVPAPEESEALALLSKHAAFYAAGELAESPGEIAAEGLWIPTTSAVDQYLKRGKDASADLSLSVPMRDYIERLEASEALQQRLSGIFLSHSDSRLPEMGGIFGAVVGSLYTLLITFVLAIPMGIASAVWLQEFASASRLMRLIEVNINNLAAVPSIIFGLFGLGVFINLLGMPRSVPLVGGIVLALMTFPTIVIASRQALVAVPASLREGALSVGATRHQMVFHHVVPFAMPSMMTGSIIGMAQALGETAPLLMLGMVAFISSAPSGVLDSATTLPVQIYLWSDSPERGIIDKTIGAILALMLFLVLMNSLAVYLRFRFERIRSQ